MTTILLATDGSPSAGRATDTALELAAATGWPIRVVTAWTVPVTAAIGFAGVSLPVELVEAEQRYAEHVAEAAVERARAAGVQATSEVREGEPSAAICVAASDNAPALVVIGAHGWGAVHRAIFGSVSNRVVHEAPCGVLVVRGTESAAA